MEFESQTNLKQVFSLLEEGKIREAKTVISNLFENSSDLDNKELEFTNRYCQFWIDTLTRLNLIQDPYEKGERLLLEWKNFLDFVHREKTIYEPALFAIQKGFFSTALQEYIKLLDAKDPFQRAEMYRRTGICYKRLGDFENAKNCLTEANAIYPNLASVLAQLADCYSLCGEDKIGKVLFREAFYNAPEFIDLDFLDSELINCLVRKTASKGYKGKALKYWIPVYGTLDGIFNIKRDLNSQEARKLQNNIYAMENEYKDPACNAEILIPKLLNSYFWLIDYYVLINENVIKINEVLLKIKILDSSIYQLYVR